MRCPLSWSTSKIFISSFLLLKSKTQKKSAKWPLESGKICVMKKHLSRSQTEKRWQLPLSTCCVTTESRLNVLHLFSAAVALLQQINWQECILWRNLNNSHEVTCEQSSWLCNLQVLYALVVIVSSWDLICWQLSYLSMKWPIPFHGTFTWPVTYYIIKHRIRTDKFQPNTGPIAFCFVFMLHFF